MSKFGKKLIASVLCAVMLCAMTACTESGQKKQESSDCDHERSQGRGYMERGSDRGKV